MIPTIFRIIYTIQNIEIKLYIKFLVARSETANMKAIEIIIPYLAH